MSAREYTRDAYTAEWIRVLDFETDIPRTLYEDTLLDLDLDDNREKKKKQEILNWLAPIDYSVEQSDIFSTHEPGTGQWMLDSEEYQRWTGQTMQTLFCPGKPGAGKTVMTSIIVNNLESRFGNDDIGIAYVYCSYRNGAQQKPVDILLNILGQLLRKQEIQDAIEDVYEKYRNKGSPPTIEKVSDLLTSVIEGYKKTFVVIDGLDEYFDVNREGFDQLNSELVRLQERTSLNLLTTSRFIEGITSHFLGCMWKEISAQPCDILRFIDARVSSLLQSRIQHIDVQDKVRNNLRASGNGTFLLARLHLESLSQEVTIEGLRKESEKLSRSLDEAYDQALKRIENQPHGHRMFARDSLSWLTYSKRELSLTEMQHALGVSPGMVVRDEQFFADMGSCGLVTVNENRDTVRLAHYTVKEYLERTWPFPNGEKSIARTCLSHLSYHAFESGISQTDYEYEKRLRTFPLYAYAAQYWAYHGNDCSNYEQLALKFLTSRQKVATAVQALFASELDVKPPGYSQKIPRKMTGMHLAALLSRADLVQLLIENGSYPDSKDSKGRTPLAWAADRGHAAVIVILLESDMVNPNSTDTSGFTPLSRAALHGYSDAVESILADSRVDPDQEDSQGRTPLARAVKKGHVAVVHLLASRSVDITAEDESGQTPLSLAMKMGREDIIEVLLASYSDQTKHDDIQECVWQALEQGQTGVLRAALDNEIIDLNQSGPRRQTPLSWAASNGNLDIMTVLLSHSRIDVNLMDDTGLTPLAWAISNGQLAAFTLLLDNENINTNSRGEFGQTPLFLAIKHGSEEMIEKLLEKDADINLEDSFGLTPLSVAVKSGRENIVNLLLNRNAQFRSQVEYEKAVISASVYTRNENLVKLLVNRVDLKPWNEDEQNLVSLELPNTDERIIRLLLEKGHSFDSEDEHAQAFLLLAIHNNDVNTVRLLLNSGVDPNSKDRDGRTALSLAARKDRIDLVWLLVDKGANPNLDEWWRAPLFIAVKKSHYQIVKLLLMKGASPNCQNGQPPLLVAVEDNEQDIARLLLEHGADPNFRCYSGDSPMSVAIERGLDGMVTLLVEKGADIQGFL